MSKNFKKTSNMGSKEKNVEVLSTKLETLHLCHDFVWVDNTPYEINVEIDPCKIGFYTNTDTANSVQYWTDTGSCGDSTTLMENDENALELETSRTSNVDLELLLGQQYMDHYESILKKANNSKQKYPNSQRMTPREDFINTRQKTIPRHPSFYKFDQSTTLILEQLAEKFNLLQFNNVVGKGNNSVVICAKHFWNPNEKRSESFAVKVFKLSCDLKRHDATFKRVQREYNHLHRLTRGYVRYIGIPRPIFRRRNVIVLSFIGDNQETAPSMMTHPPKPTIEAYYSIVNVMETLYIKYNLIHGKLCDKNILYWHEYPYLIGWSHAVGRGHPLALKKLIKDCHFVTEYYKGRGVPVKSTEQLFKDITGLEKISSSVLEEIYNQKSTKTCQITNLLTNPNVPRKHLNCRRISGFEVTSY